MQINDNIKIQEHIKLESISISYGRTNSQYYQLCVCLCQCNKLRNKWLIFMRISKIAIPPNDMPPFHNLIPWWGGTLKMMWIQHDCPASFHETCQWLKFPLNGLRAQSRVSPVVGLLPLNYKNTRETGYIMWIECLATGYQGLWNNIPQLAEEIMVDR